MVGSFILLLLPTILTWHTIERFHWVKKAFFSGILDYLRTEEHLNERIGAVSLGAFLGLLLGWKKNFFKKALCTVTGGLAVTALCYPIEAKEYSTMGFSGVKKVVEASIQFLQGGELFG